MASINSYLYTNAYNYNAAGLLNSYGAAKTTQYRGNVTGWAARDKDGHVMGGLSASDTRSFLAAVKSFGSALSSVLNSLSGKKESVFTKVSGASSNEEALSVRVTNQTEALKLGKSSIDVGVQQVAAAQKNAGSALSATAVSAAAKGTSQFTIEKGGKSYAFSVSVGTVDSNRTVQQKMADAINRQNIGVTASVVYDDKSKNSSLVVTSKETGAKEAFTMKDSVGDLVAKTGVGTVSQQAQDAKYTVNGKSETSAKNDVDLGNGLAAALKKTTSEDVKVGVKKDETAITNAIYAVVNNFNGLREAAIDAGKDKNANGLRQRLDTLSSAYAVGLSNIGITRNKDGYLQIDTDKLKKAVESGAAEKALGGDAGFNQRISQVAKAADTNPNQFVSYQSRKNMNNAAAGDNYLDNIKLTPFQTLKSQQWDSIGLLLNMGV